MDSGNSTMLESAGEDAMLIETVKSIVSSESESEDFFLMSQGPNEQESYPQDKVEQTSAPHKHETLVWTQLCRICANLNDQTVPIFEGEGTEHDLPSKILKYLPIHVSKTDTLPLQLCYRCVGTLLAWHELCEGCLSAEKRLLEMQDTLENKQQCYNPTPSENSEISTLDAATTMTIASNTANSQSEQQVDGVCDTEDNVCSRSCGVRTPLRVFLDTQNAFWKPYRKRCRPKATRSVKRPSATMTEDCDSVWIMDAALNQPPTMSEQLENNDPLRLPFETKERYVTTQQSVRDIEHASHRTAIAREEKDQMDEILDHDSPCSPGNGRDDKNPCETGKASLKEELFRCIECGKRFKLKDSYHRHMRIHKNERPFTCHVCGKQFRDSGGLTRHVRDVHAKLKNFMCDLCGRSFASKATREDHRRTHTGERPYVCDSCGKMFKSKAALYIHSKLHTDEFPFPCTYCAKRFRRRQELMAHVTTHTGEKNHACDVCTKKFRIKSELARHKLIHSDDKPFVCGKCGLAFRQKRYLNNHIKSRHNETL